MPIANRCPECGAEFPADALEGPCPHCLTRPALKPVESLKSHQLALAIRQKLADSNPSVTDFQHQLVRSYDCIGVLLSESGKSAEAMKAYEAELAIHQKLVEEHPESPDFACSLGGNLNNIAEIDIKSKRFEAARVRLRQAVEWQRKALKTQPANPNYRLFLDIHLTNLIEIAYRLGDSTGRAETERERANLRDADPAMAGLDARLAATLKDETPRTNAERLAMAQRASDRSFYSSAARLFGEALAADPELASDRQAGHRYSAARAAVLAASWPGRDDPAPDDAARTKLRRQALDWLKAELSAWKRVAQTSEPGNKEPIAVTLQSWKDEIDLSTVRDEKELARLPSDERNEWQSFWADLEALLRPNQSEK
jgi:tetratricopeptide (TPR) repeat protein